MSNALLRWCGWFLLANIAFYWVIASGYLDIILSEFGSSNYSSSFDQLLNQYQNLFAFIAFNFFSFLGYIGLLAIIAFCIPSLLAYFHSNKWIVFIISVFSITLVACYLIADSRVYALYRFHINSTILQLVFSREVSEVLGLSWQEQSYLIFGIVAVFFFECCLGYLIWKYLTRFSCQSLIKFTLSVIIISLLLSIQLYLIASHNLIVVRIFALLLISGFILAFIRTWHKPSALLPTACLLFVFSIATFIASFNLQQTILVISLALLIFLYVQFSKQHRMRLSIFLFLITGILAKYEFFVIEYITPIRQIIEASYILPYYTQMLQTFTHLGNTTKIDKTGNGLFMQPKGVINQLHYPLHPLQQQQLSPNYNILFIVIDAWRFDALNVELTPNLAKFATTATQFTNHWSGGNSTQPGIFSLFYGLPDSYWSSMLDQQQGPVFIHALLQKKYQLGIFGSAPLNLPAFNKNIFREVPNLNLITQGNYPVDRDKQITAEFANFVAANSITKKPFFSFLFYDAAHSYCANGNPVHKFQPEVKHCDRFFLTNASNPIYLLNRYKNALFEVDTLVGQVLAILQKNALLKNTIVVVTGDHGEEFNDNHLNYWGHASNFSHYQVQTPLIIYWPNKSPSLNNQLTTHYDIVPTLMTHSLGYLNPPSDYSIGKDLLQNNIDTTYFIVESYNSKAIIEKNRITSLLPDGEFIIYDTKYHAIPNASINSQVLSQAMQDMVRFY